MRCRHCHGFVKHHYCGGAAAICLVYPFYHTMTMMYLCNPKCSAMKKSSIIILVLIAATMAVLVASLGSFGTYETFKSAAERPGKTFHVVAQLDTTQAMQYDPIANANQFSFYARDKKNNSHKVVFNGTKPTDFERAEQLVMTGYMEGDLFRCTKIQMKCPSKYEDQKVVVANNQ